MLHLQPYWPFIQTESAYARGVTIGWIALVIGVLAGATFSAFAKQLGSALSPLSILFVGETMMLLFTLFSFGTIRLVEESRRLTHAQIIPLLMIGLLATLGLTLIFTGMHSTSATNAELFGRAETVFLIVLAIFILHERLTQLHVVGGFLILLGITVVSFRGFTEVISLRTGDLLIMWGALCFATVSIILKKYLANVPPELILFTRSAIAILTFFLFSPFIEQRFIEEIRLLPLHLFPPLLGFGFLSRFIATLGIYQAIERLPITTISFFTPVSMVLAVIFAHFYLGEPLLPYHFAGGGLILCGIFLTRTNGVHTTEEQVVVITKQHHRHHF
ncbi:DMT family transporter [Candidatus Peregrinibacteria bacterium]|nr:DMT family transporter [Candidatus Peregrinibacteria bacterium]